MVVIRKVGQYDKSMPTEEKLDMDDLQEDLTNIKQDNKFVLLKKSPRLIPLYITFKPDNKEDEICRVFDVLEQYFHENSMADYVKFRTVNNDNIFELYATIIKSTEYACLKLQAFEFEEDENQIGLDFINVVGSAFIVSEIYLQLIQIFKQKNLSVVNVSDDHNDGLLFHDDDLLSHDDGLLSDMDEELSDSWDSSSEEEEDSQNNNVISETEDTYLNFASEPSLLSRYIEDLTSTDSDKQVEALVLISHNIKSETTWDLIQEKHCKMLATGLVYILDGILTKKVAFMAIRLAMEILQTIVHVHDETSFPVDNDITEEKFEEYEANWKERLDKDLNGYWKTGTKVEDCFEAISKQCF